MVALACNHLGGGVAWRAAGCLQSGVWLVHVAKAEIDDLEGQVVVKQKVLWLQVSMADATLVDVLNTRNKLEVKLASLLF